MDLEIRCGCGRTLRTTSGDAGMTYRCPCGRAVAVPNFAELRRLTPPPPRPWECPRCGSAEVERLPPSQISPHPGYRCTGCGALLRAPAMAVVYWAALLLGSGMAALCVGLLFGENDARAPLRMVWLGGVGAVCAGYAVRQLARPVPRRRPPADDGE